MCSLSSAKKEDCSSYNGTFDSPTPTNAQKPKVTQGYEHQSLGDKTRRAHWLFFPCWSVCGYSLLRQPGTPFLAYWVPDLHTGHFARTELKDIGTKILNFQSLKGCPLQVPHHSGRKASLPRGSYLPKGWDFFFFFFTRLPGQDTVLPCQSAITVIISHLNLERRHRSPGHRPKMLRP